MTTPIDVTAAQARQWLQTSGFSLGTSQFTYSVPGSGATWAGYAAGSEPFSSSYAAPGATLAAGFRAAISQWDRLIAPDFAEVVESGSTVGELRVAVTDVGGSFGYAYSGTPQAPGRRPGDIWISPTQANASYAVGDYSLMAMLHEVGHTLGLKHSFDAPTVPAQYDNYRYTIMSYSQAETAVRFTAQGNGVNASSASIVAATPMVLDILAVQAIYGAEPGTAAGDTVYTFTPMANYLQTIWDGGGSDRIDATNFTTRVAIDLRPGAYSSLGIMTAADQIAYWSALFPNSASFIRQVISGTANLFTYTDNVAIAFGATIEHATGGSAADELVGNDVANLLNGGPGADTMTGGIGNDTFVVDNAGDVIVEMAGQGSDTVLAGVDYTLATGAEVEVLAVTDRNSTGAVNLTGSFSSQAITGNAGANILNGFGGADTLAGLAGNDTYLVRGPGDQVLENNFEGDDTVFTTVSYSLGANEVERLSTVTQAETTPIDLIGNYATQLVIGNYGSNVLNGGSGGVDTLIGLFGNDVYAVGDSRTAIIENAGEGDDTVVAAVDYALAAGVSVEVLSAQNRGFSTPLVLRGNEFAQTILGNGGPNTIDGGGGNDQLLGGGGADSFRFTSALGAANVDSLVDFGSDDRIGLARAIFGLASVTAADFVVGSAATNAQQRIVYNQAAGQLFFDADGSGSGAAVLFALLPASTALTTANFEIV